jgi:hypothetical protein
MSPYDGSDFEDVDPESRIREVAQEELWNQAVQFQLKWRSNLRDAGWVNDGEAVADVTIDPPREGSDSYLVGGDLIQLLIGEFGRRPGSKAPPPDKLGEWVNEQAGLPSKGDDDFDSAVYLIGQSIAENGIEPTRSARRAWKTMEDLYEDSVEAELGDE